MNQSEFIEKCKDVHENKYDYSLTEYNKHSEKIKIICPIHGLFHQRAGHHIQGRGCKECGKLKKSRKTTKDFIYESKNIHGDRYDYSLVNYVNNITKVKIKDKVTGKIFEQTPQSHLKSRNSIIFSKNKRLDTQSFIEKSKKIHGDKYDYSDVEYTGCFEKVKIICPIHGEFMQSASSHLQGSGCRYCNMGSVKCERDRFIQKSKLIHGDKYDYTQVDYNGVLNDIILICPIHGKFKINAGNHIRGSSCLKCNIRNPKNHKRLKQFFDDNNIDYIENDRSIIKPLELDFYIPKYNIAIEINGVYWHGENKGKGKKYHLNKLELCEKKSIRLIHLNDIEFETEHILFSRLKSVLNINKFKIYARKCEVREIDSKLKSKFLKKYHSQGDDKSSIKLGLFYNNKLISVMTFGKNRFSKSDGYELIRFSGNFNFYVIGGASKLLKYFERNYNPNKIVTYADKRWSTGDLYFKLGFKHIHDSAPNYWYFKNNNKLHHRMKFQKHKLNKILDFFDNGKTEWQNMKYNGWDRIWDCGNMVFEKETDK